MGNYKNFNTDQKTEFWSEHFNLWGETRIISEKIL